MLRTGFVIYDELGHQVFGLDSLTAENLYRRGNRRFDLPHGMHVRLLCDLPQAQDLTAANAAANIPPRMPDTIRERLAAIGARYFGMRRTAETD